MSIRIQSRIVAVAREEKRVVDGHGSGVRAGLLPPLAFGEGNLGREARDRRKTVLPLARVEDVERTAGDAVVRRGGGDEPVRTGDVLHLGGTRDVARPVAVEVRMSYICKA